MLQAGFLASLDAVHVARELLVPVLLGLVLGMKTSSQLRGHPGKDLWCFGAWRAPGERSGALQW